MQFQIKQYDSSDYDMESTFEAECQNGWIPILMSQVFVPGNGDRSSLGGTLDEVQLTIIYRKDNPEERME